MLIHIGRFQPDGTPHYLFLRKSGENLYIWHAVDTTLKIETKTPCEGNTPAEAIFQARKQWALDSFRTLNCGFCYALPERDEVGSNAFFWQMALSYASFNGTYFDEEVGHLCFVDFASEEALNLWRKMRDQERLSPK